MADIDICLPLLKFSHATGLVDGRIAWDHISGHNIFVVLKGSRHEGRSLILRVVQGTKDLEQVDLGFYIDAAQDRRRQDHRAGLPSAIDQLPIFAISKESLLAIRYTVKGEPRRLQLRLQGSSQCEQLVQIMKHRGMVYQDQRPRTGRPNTAASRPDTAYSDMTPLTAQVNSPHFEQGQPRHTSHGTNPESQVVSQTLSTTAGRDSTVQAHVSSNKTYDIPAPPSFARSTPSAPYTLNPNGPTTAEIYGTRPEQYKMPEIRKFQPLPYADCFSSNKDSQPISAADRGALIDKPQDHALPTESAPGLSSAGRSPPRSQHSSSAAFETHVSAPWSSDPAGPRPITALSTTSMAEILDHEIPPRRELPFKRPSSSRSGGSRPGSSTLTLPSLKRPKLSDTDMRPARPETAATNTGNIDTAHIARPTTVGSFHATSGVRTVTQRDLASERPASSKQIFQPSPAETIPMDELLYGKRTSSLRKEHKSIPRIGSITDAPHEIESPPSTADANAHPISPVTKQSSTAPSSARDKGIDRAYAALKATPQDVSEASLESYEGQSLEDRKAALDKFMMDMLENPAFTTLCEDVENCWRRIALGL